jgi:catechol 2,3-dioxygenase
MANKPRRLGHVNLYVRDIEKAEKFYGDLLGLHTYERRPGQAVFMSADLEQAHELALMQLGPDAGGPGQNQVGLNHIAWQMDSFEDLKAFYGRLKEKGVAIKGIGDHGVALGIYIQDPDGNGNEVYYELPRSQWPKEGPLFKGTFPMSLEDEPAKATATP